MRQQNAYPSYGSS